MATLTLDALENAQINETSQQTTIVRTGWIKGVNLLAMGSPDQKFAACVGVAGMPNENAPYPGTGYTDCLLRRRLFDTYSRDPKKVRVTLIYEAIRGNGAAATFILSRRTNMINVLTERDPKTGKPIVVQWADPTNVGRMIARTARIPIRIPLQRIVAEAWYHGEPPAAMIDALGSVNSQPWRGKPKGYWFYADQSDVTRDRGNTYTISLELESYLRKDWSEYAFLRNPNGVYIPIDPSELADAVALPYSYGKWVFNGFTRVDPYPEEDFGSIFGFGGIGA